MQKQPKTNSQKYFCRSPAVSRFCKLCSCTCILSQILWLLIGMLLLTFETPASAAVAKSSDFVASREDAPLEETDFDYGPDDAADAPPQKHLDYHDQYPD